MYSICLINLTNVIYETILANFDRLLKLQMVPTCQWLHQIRQISQSSKSIKNDKLTHDNEVVGWFKKIACYVSAA